ncbi:fatty-acyl-CoA synthase [Sinobacterium caligoides]|uniref:Fatty-acyl-CoA synthase n=1 Tax=Sinobacterium caligoides TaxID=933926 RepID=A0A3N2E096_9GAMM|nr:AMP-binding protein [Sinobacterium caligoides]ROS05520.1 fatty-acyl-CoA synthase [Sinobacterium caligoides]
MTEQLPPPLTPVTFLERCGRFYGERTAVNFNGNLISFEKMLARCKSAAQFLIDKGVEDGTKISLISTNNIAVIESHFFVPASQAVLVTINPTLSISEILYQVVFSKSRFVITTDKFYRLYQEELNELREGNDITFVIYSDSDDHQEENEQLFNYSTMINWVSNIASLDGLINSELSPIGINFTSGTTGNPKAVVFTHRAAYLQAMGQCLLMKLDRHSIYYCMLPLFHGNGWFHIWANIAVGAKQILFTKISSSSLVDDLIKHSVTHCAGSPRLLSKLFEGTPGNQLKGMTVMTGGAAPTSELIENMEYHGIELIQQYGLNESCATFTVTEKDDNWQSYDLNEKVHALSKQGIPAIHAGYGLRVVNDEGKDVERDAESVGEIWLRGNTISEGYYGNEKETSKSYLGGWFRTGDLAVMDKSGSIVLKDRIKDTFFIETADGWLNVSTLEVERVISQCDCVNDIAVVGLVDPSSGSNILVAFVETDSTTSYQSEIREFCKSNLGEYQVPTLIVKTLLPKTATGKIQKHRLKVLNVEEYMASQVFESF